MREGRERKGGGKGGGLEVERKRGQDSEKGNGFGGCREKGLQM